MPTYDYKCLECEAVFEAFHGMNESPKLECNQCSSLNTQKKIGMGAGVHFKGSGFYVTDYKKSSSTTNSPSSEKSPSATKTEVKSSTGHTCNGACSH